MKYADGEYRGDSKLGKRMHDFHCISVDERKFQVLTERMWYPKEDPEGVKIMCQIMEELREESLQEGRKENAVNTARRMLADGVLPLEKIAKYAGLTLKEVKRLKAGKSA